MSHRHHCPVEAHDWHCDSRDCQCICGSLMEEHDHADCPAELRACPEHEPAPEPKFIEKQRERLRILICEDDEGQLNWLVSRLKGAGNFVSTAHEGDQAFAKWQNGKPWDFVITDYLFVPGARIRNGLDLVREIHSVDLSQKIVVQSGEWNLVVPRGVKLLRKPFPFQRLIRVMKHMQTMNPLPLFRT